MCHGSGERHRTIISEGDCAACHHASERIRLCANCHGPERRAAGSVSVRMDLTVWDEARTRRLPFGHDVHAERACTDCHRAPETMAPVQCAECHAEHHRPEAECTACHGVAPEAAHPVDAHLTCAGAGCHAASVAPPPALSRTLCLLCHDNQVAHEPGLECAGCHEVPGAHAPPARSDTAVPTPRGTR